MVQHTGLPAVTVNRPSILKAVLIAPLGAPLSITFMAAWESVSLSGLSGLGDLPVAALLFFLFGLPVSYGAMLILGLPYLVWLRSNGCLTWSSTCVGAAILSSALWSGYWQLSLRRPSLTHTIPAGMLIGLVVGVIFSLIAGLPSRSLKREIRR
jgi:hypothetical protein